MLFMNRLHRHIYIGAHFCKMSFSCPNICMKSSKGVDTNIANAVMLTSIIILSFSLCRIFDIIFGNKSKYLESCQLRKTKFNRVIAVKFVILCKSRLYKSPLLTLLFWFISFFGVKAEQNINVSLFIIVIKWIGTWENICAF